MKSIIDIRDLRVTNPSDKSTMLMIDHLQIKQGSFNVILGENGCGKSTLLHTIAGRAPHEGSVSIGGKNLNLRSFGHKPPEVRLLEQDPSHGLFPELTLAENLMLSGYRNRGKDNLLNPDSCRACSIFTPKMLSLKDRPAKLLSGGEKQTLALAMCLIRPPKLLLLDEYTSAMDQKRSIFTTQYLSQLCRQMGLTILAVTHEPTLVKAHVDRWISIEEGNIDG